METAVTNLLGSAGFSAIGFAIAFFVLKEKFKQDKETISALSHDLKELCQTIMNLIEIMNDLRLSEVAGQEIDRNVKEEIKDNYIKISNKIEAQNAKIDDIYILCVKIYEQSGRIPVGQVALAKGYLNEEQLKECLEIQNTRSGKNDSNYHKEK